MGPSWEFNYNIIALNEYVHFHVDKLSGNCGTSTVFEPPRFLGQEMIESISNHGHQNIKVHFNQHRGGKGVKTEEFDCFSYAVFNPPSLGVAEYE